MSHAIPVVPCSAAGYAESGRLRTQRDLRREYERVQRFQGIVNKVRVVCACIPAHVCTALVAQVCLLAWRDHL